MGSTLSWFGRKKPQPEWTVEVQESGIARKGMEFQATIFRNGEFYHQVYARSREKVIARAREEKAAYRAAQERAAARERFDL